MRFLSYEFIPEAGRDVRLESGFGLANIIGVLALLWALAWLPFLAMALFVIGLQTAAFTKTVRRNRAERRPGSGSL